MSVGQRTRIVSWNINGLRSFQVAQLRQLLSVDLCSPDIACFQETKINRDTLTADFASIDGVYDGFFSFSRRRPGYSGVGTFCVPSATATKADEGLSSCFSTRRAASSSDTIGCFAVEFESQIRADRLDELDAEGRALITEHRVVTAAGDERSLCVINVYCPRASPDSGQTSSQSSNRLEYKLDFYRLLEARTRSLIAAGHLVVIVGDFNVAHRPIDSGHEEDIEFDRENESRAWLEALLSTGDLVDSYRFFHPSTSDSYTCWSACTGARQTNFGARIDYALVSREIIDRGWLYACEHRPEILGSDHCPLLVEFSFTSAEAVPSSPSASVRLLCARFWPEFKGRQLSLDSFVKRRASIELSNDAPTQKEDRAAGRKRKAETARPGGKLTDFFSRVEVKVAMKTELVDISGSDEAPLKRVPGGTADDWKRILRGPAPPPVCVGHREACVLRTVRKEGANKDRQFWCCPRPEGKKGNAEARCAFFEWKK